VGISINKITGINSTNLFWFVHNFTSSNVTVTCFKNDHQDKQVNMKISSTAL